MPTNLTDFVDWTSPNYALRMHGDEMHIVDKWINTIVRINVMCPKSAAIDILRTFGFTGGTL